MKETGIAVRMIIGPEFEFYPFDQTRFQVSPSQSAYHIEPRQAEWNCRLGVSGNNGYEVPYKDGYHIAVPQDIGYDLRSKMCLAIEDLVLLSTNSFKRLVPAIKLL